MLAYVFWHRPRRGVDHGSYESALIAFCHVLMAASPPGLVSASTASLDRAPFSWAPLLASDGSDEDGAGPVYEDWYAIEDSAALDVIEAAAVGPQCATAHGAVASMAARGTAGVYRRAEGGPSPGPAADDAEEPVTWVDLPPGVGRRTWTADLATRVGARSLWTRTLTLGPAPEFCLEGAGPDLPGALVVHRRRLG